MWGTLSHFQIFSPKSMQQELTIGKLNFRTISAKSSFLSLTWDCPAAKWLQTKHRLVVWNSMRMATAPLFPVAPPMPVFTVSTATSL